MLDCFDSATRADAKINETTLQIFNVTWSHDITNHYLSHVEDTMLHYHDYDLTTNSLPLFIPSGTKKRPEHPHALFDQMVKVNQHKNIFVMIEHQRICVKIFA